MHDGYVMVWGVDALRGKAAMNAVLHSGYDARRGV
jgi:hypothetical protein